MPKPSTHTLLWSAQSNIYALVTLNHPPQEIVPGNEEPWVAWLTTHSSFSFQGQYGHLSVLKESRSRGAGYWYAYHTQEGQTRKRYLGRSELVTLTRLEEVAQDLGSKPSPAPPAPLPPVPPSEHRGVLLSTKLSPPRLPGSLVERSRLLAELDAARSHPVTLVCAPAGSGKTTLLSAWAASLQQAGRGKAGGTKREEAKQAVTWLSLDALDTEPIRFWTSIIVALRAGLPTIGEEALALLRLAQSPPLSTCLSTLLNELAQVDREIILILDDYHVIEDQAIHESLLFLIDHLPANLHLVLTTRTDPELPLSRWRVRGQLIEIRNQDLRFTQAEAASFLVQRMGLPLTEEDVAILATRTEGWIAGLQLAVLSLRKQQDLSSWIADFAGSSRFVLDYVQQDILVRLPVPLQHFLLQTSMVTRMNAALCQAITAAPTREVCQQMLEEVERANLFLVPLDEQRQWYRFHDLFREALLARLHAAQPQLVPLLHIRAASFYEAAGEWQEAIAHALSAPDYALAASLMEQAASHFWLRGQVRIVHNWTLALPDAVLRAHLRLALGAALRFVDSVNLNNATLHASMAAQVERTFTRMEELLRRPLQWTLSEAEVTLIGRGLRLLRAWIELRAIARHGNIGRLRLLSQEIEALPQDAEVSWNIIPLSIAFWLTAVYEGEGASLIPRLRSAKQQMIEAGDSPVTIRVMSWLALTYTQAAQLHLAHQQCLEALALVERIGRPTALAGYLYYTLFFIFYAWNRLEEAADWLQRMVRSAQDWQQVELLAMGEIFAARLALARGDHSRAEEALHQLEALVEQEGFAHHALWVNTLRVQCWLAEGKLAEASEWAAQSTLSPETWNPLRRWEVLMLVRVLLAQQQYAQAVETLSRFSQYFDQPGAIDTALEWMALSVVAHHYAGKPEQAMCVAARLLALAEPEGYARVYLDTGEPMMKQVLKVLLEAEPDDAPGAAPGSISRSSVSRWLSAFEQEETGAAHHVLRRSAKTQTIQSEPQPAEVQQMAEPLSPQELKVLRLLVAGRTYAEMAQTLIVSVHTIKTQVSSIYRKLGVSRRAEAIASTHHVDLL
jgi:LuxR family maltose regulon positive regulatory protein